MEERRKRYDRVDFADRRKDNASIYLQRLRELTSNLPSEPSQDVFECEEFLFFKKNGGVSQWLK